MAGRLFFELDAMSNVETVAFEGIPAHHWSARPRADCECCEPVAAIPHPPLPSSATTDALTLLLSRSSGISRHFTSRRSSTAHFKQQSALCTVGARILGAKGAEGERSDDSRARVVDVYNALQPLQYIQPLKYINRLQYIHPLYTAPLWLRVATHWALTLRPNFVHT